MLAKSTRSGSAIASDSRTKRASQALGLGVSSAAQRNDLIESRASHLLIQCSGGCERDEVAKLAH